MSLTHRLRIVSVLGGLTIVATALAFGALAIGTWRPAAAVAGTVAVASALASSVAAVGALRGLVRPLQQLADAASHVMTGSFDPEVGDKAAPELRAVVAALREAARDVRRRRWELDSTRSAFRRAVSRLGEVLASTHDLDGIVAAIVDTSLLVVPADAAVYYRLAASPDHLEVVHARGAPVGGALLAGSGLAGAAATTRRVATISVRPMSRVAELAVALTAADLDPAEPRAVAGVATPLRSLGRLVGVLAVYGNTVGRPFTEEETALLLSLVRQAELAITNVELHERARREALTDDVTGLWNRRHFDVRLREAVSGYQRFAEQFSIAIFDLDDFKQVNDRWDHLTGDAALVHFAAVLRQAIREADVPCRWGGEEFAVLLRRTGPAEAGAVAQRVVELLRASPLERGGRRIHLTVSAGVSSFPWDGTTAAEVLERADVALLCAKARGKDRVERASAPPTAAPPDPRPAPPPPPTPLMVPPRAGVAVDTVGRPPPASQP